MRIARRAIVLAVVVVLAATVVIAQRSANQDVPRPATDADAGNLPIVMIDVAERPLSKDSKVTGSVRIIEQHDGTHTDLEDDPATAQARVAIEVRGDSTVNLPKRSFNIELQNNDGEERSLPLLGLPSHSDWVLHGCGRDQTCVRNAFAYALSRDLGHYAPRTRFVELYLDDTYQGLYVLVERIRRDRNRVNVPRPAASVEDGDISGGYIFRMELGQGRPGDAVARDWVSPAAPMIYSYHYPRFDRITSAQREHLRNHMAGFETMMAGSAWRDGQAGYRTWIDLASWMDFTLLQELANNVDAYHKSLYLQKWPRSRGNRIALGPVWDFDNAFGSPDFRDGRRTDVWAHSMNRFGAERVAYAPPSEVPYVPAYWSRLWSDPAFQTDLRCRWQELRQGPLAEGRITSRIDTLVQELTPALSRPGPLGSNPKRDGYRDEVDDLKSFLTRRLAWMDTNLPGRCSRT